MTQDPATTITLPYAVCKNAAETVSTDASRPILAYARIADATLSTTNGHILIQQPILGWPDNASHVRYVHRDTLRQVKAGGRMTLDLATGVAYAISKDEYVTSLGVQHAAPNSVEGAPDTYPNLDRIIPAYEADEGVTFRLSGRYLKALGEIAIRMDAECVIFQIVDPLRALKVDIEGAASGLVMPMREVK